MKGIHIGIGIGTQIHIRNIIHKSMDTNFSVVDKLFTWKV